MLTARARTSGIAVRHRAAAKHHSYPGPQLIAFVMGAGGAMGREAVEFLRCQAQELPPEQRSRALQEVRQSLNVALQSANTDALLTKRSRFPLSYSVGYTSYDH